MEPIIDAHHHIWRHADQPWLQGPAVPRIFGEYEGLRRDYPAEDFIADLKDTGVVKLGLRADQLAAEPGSRGSRVCAGECDAHRLAARHRFLRQFPERGCAGRHGGAGRRLQNDDARRAPAAALAHQSAIQVRSRRPTR